MSLQDVDDLHGSLREAARVLRPQGRLCAAVVHPLTSAGRFVGRDPDSPFVVAGSYLELRFIHSHGLLLDRETLTLGTAPCGQVAVN